MRGHAKKIDLTLFFLSRPDLIVKPYKPFVNVFDTHHLLQKTSFNVLKNDGLVKSLKIHLSLIPTKAGIQSFQIVINSLDSGFHRSDDFLRIHQKMI